MRTVLAALLTAGALPCWAADITVKGNTITIAGTIEVDDDVLFENRAAPYDQTMTVHLHSKGGVTTPALAIGKFIRAHGRNAHVDYTCFSSCAWLWLSGIKRYKTQEAQIAFHSTRNQKTRERANNVNVAIYLIDLGYSPKVVDFTTTTDELRLMTDNDARRLGIAFTATKPSALRSAFSNVNMNKIPDLPKPGFTPGPRLVTGIKEKADKLVADPTWTPIPLQPWTVKNPAENAPVDVLKAGKQGEGQGSRDLISETMRGYKP
jgi:hypothetical protein